MIILSNFFFVFRILRSVEDYDYKGFRHCVASGSSSGLQPPFLR